MAIMTILKQLQVFTSKLLKIFCFTLTCDNAFLTTPFSTGKTSQNFVVYTVNTRTKIFANSVENELFLPLAKLL